MGRPREFCLQGALEKALEVFWRHGFEGASMADLTAAMGITKPSLYASYGNKEELFRKALDLYDCKYMGFMREALEAGSSREVAAGILHGMVGASASDGEHPPGCMSVNGALACSAAADPIKEETTRRRKVFEGDLARRLERDRARGDLPADSDPIGPGELRHDAGVRHRLPGGLRRFRRIAAQDGGVGAGRMAVSCRRPRRDARNLRLILPPIARYHTDR